MFHHSQSLLCFAYIHRLYATHKSKPKPSSNGIHLLLCVIDSERCTDRCRCLDLFCARVTDFYWNFNKNERNIDCVSLQIIISAAEQTENEKKKSREEKKI